MPRNSTAEMEGEWQFTRDGDEKSAVWKTPAEANLPPGCNTGLLCKPEEVIAQLASMLIRSQLDQVSYLGHILAKMLIN